MSSLDNMLKILDLFGEQRHQASTDEIVNYLGVSKATAYRYIKSLANTGLVATDGGMVSLGPRIIELDRLVRLTDPLTTAARPVMEEVADRLGLNIMLCRYYGDKVMCADQIWPDDSIRSSYQRGRPMPLFSGATAKTILAHLSTYQLNNIMLQHADEIAVAGLGRNWAEFSANIRALRRERILISHGEVDPGLVGIGAPLFDSGSRIVGSLIFIVDEARLSALGTDWLKQQIGQAADRINNCMRLSADPAP